MGEIADMMLDGDLCEGCGEYLGDGGGYARKCSGCQPRRKEKTIRRTKAERPPEQKIQFTSADSRRSYDDDYTMGEYWQGYKEHKQERKQLYQQNTIPQDKELLNSLAAKGVTWKLSVDGSGGDRYVITVPTDRGERVVEWWCSTGLWKVQKGKGEGYGIYRMARYFQLIDRRQLNNNERQTR